MDLFTALSNFCPNCCGITGRMLHGHMLNGPQFAHLSKTAIAYMQICNGCFTQVSKLWPIGPLVGLHGMVMTVICLLGGEECIVYKSDYSFSCLLY